MSHITGINVKENEDEKRRSTGSISSLKKIWEAKESTAPDQSQLSPKLGTKTTSGDQNNDEIINKKPAVPVKPSKLIYATPTLPKTANNTADALNIIPIGGSAANLSGREGILELITVLESSLKIPVNSISAAQWLQLSERLNVLQSSCVTFADKESMPPHSKFQFRELVTRVENQSRCLRSAGSKNVQDNEKLVHEVGQSLRQISNALHR